MKAEIVVKHNNEVVSRGRYARVQKSHNKYTIECYNEKMINDIGDDRHVIDVRVNDQHINYDSIDVITSDTCWYIVVYMK